MLTVAILSENDSYDGVVYARLLARVLGLPVEKWQTDLRFSGWRSIARLADTYLKRADAAGVGHALLAIDNDGGARRHPEHAAEHVSAAEAKDEDSGCRTCWLLEKIPPWWTSAERRRCVVVPVQTFETWLLSIRGDPFDGEAEKTYHRQTLKKRFFGAPMPHEEERTRRALAQLEAEHAVKVLRLRPSFRRFEEELRGWRPALGEVA